jgi:type IV pilus assembly protein PilF
MSLPPRFRNLLPAVGLWVLAACSTPDVREDPGANLGTDRDARPGDIYAQMGSEYMKEGQPGTALRKLKRGLVVDPDNARIHAVLGLLYDQLGETDAARLNYSRAVELEPQDPYFQNALGSFLCKEQNYEAADRHFKLALRNPLYATPWAAATNAGVCAFRAGRNDQAETYLRQALSSNPQIPLALLKMAQISLSKPDLEGARSYLSRYEQVSPPNPETLLLGARIEYQLGNLENATRYRTALETRFPDSPETQSAKELF